MVHRKGFIAFAHRRFIQQANWIRQMWSDTLFNKFQICRFLLKVLWWATC